MSVYPWDYTWPSISLFLCLVFVLCLSWGWPELHIFSPPHYRDEGGLTKEVPCWRTEGDQCTREQTQCLQEPGPFHERLTEMPGLCFVTVDTRMCDCLTPLASGKGCGKDPISSICQGTDPALQWQREMKSVPRAPDPQATFDRVYYAFFERWGACHKDVES